AELTDDHVECAALERKLQRISLPPLDVLRVSQTRSSIVEHRRIQVCRHRSGVLELRSQRPRHGPCPTRDFQDRLWTQCHNPFRQVVCIRLKDQRYEVAVVELRNWSRRISYRPTP